MTRRPLLLALPLLLLTACADDAPEADLETLAAARYQPYGQTFEQDGAVPVQAVVAEPELYAGQTVKVEGTIQEVCRMKGCWLTLDAGEGRTLRILTERKADGGYVFTVPTDVSGRRAVVVGRLERTVLSADEQRHLAEDAGETLAGDVAPKEALQVTATGVLVERASETDAADA